MQAIVRAKADSNVFDIVSPNPAPEGALCQQVDPELFFPSKGGSARPAKRICGQCASREACLEWALDNPDADGILGGTTTRERRKIRLARASAPPKIDLPKINLSPDRTVDVPRKAA